MTVSAVVEQNWETKARRNISTGAYLRKLSEGESQDCVTNECKVRVTKEKKKEMMEKDCCEMVLLACFFVCWI